MPRDIIILQMCARNYDHMMYDSWNMVCDRQMDGWTNGQKKWHKEMGAPPKNDYLYTVKMKNWTKLWNL